MYEVLVGLPCAVYFESYNRTHDAFSLALDHKCVMFSGITIGFVVLAARS